jgi:hypothetical protein
LGSVISFQLKGEEMSNLPAGGSQTNGKGPAAIPAGRSLLDAGNRLKLGLFGFNCSNGLSLTSADTSFDASWDQTLAIARRADEIGMEMLIPIARWRGLGGDTDPFRRSFETSPTSACLESIDFLLARYVDQCPATFMTAALRSGHRSRPTASKDP